MCYQPQTKFSCPCRCVQPRYADELPVDEDPALVRSEDGTVYEYCEAAQFSKKLCCKQRILPHPKYSVKVKAWCVDCLSKQYSQPPKTDERARGGTFSKMFSRKNKDRDCHGAVVDSMDPVDRRSSMVSAEQRVQSLWGHVKESMDKKKKKKTKDAKEESEPAGQ